MTMIEDPELKNKIAICTGASSGIGRRMARTLAFGGASVFLVGRQKEKLESLVSEINENSVGKGIAFPTDLTSEGTFSDLYSQCCDILGAPNILINAAGVNFREPWDTITHDSWNTTLKINLSVPFFLARECVPEMKKNGWGRVINIASLQSFRAFPNSIAYGASKGGIAQVTRAMAESWSANGIMVNAIVPGFFSTPMTAPVFNDPKISQHNAKMTAVGRNGKMSDLDGITIFLASKASDYITGQIINVDGGYSAK